MLKLETSLSGLFFDSNLVYTITSYCLFLCFFMCLFQALTMHIEISSFKATMYNTSLVTKGISSIK